MKLAVDLVRRFYPESLDAIMGWTLQKFLGSLQSIPKILKMETGDEKGEQETPLSGPVGFQAMKAIIPKGTRRR